MAGKWVDNEVYFGPDRRRRGAPKRWGERRRTNEAGEPPPLGAVLRRLRVQLLDVGDADDRRRALQLASLAAAEADKLRLSECADLIRAATQLILANDIATADTRIIDAQALASAAPIYTGYR